MHRNLLSVFVCASVALSPLAQASAQDYIFRHKYPVNYAPPAAGEEEIGIGNDIVAYYTAPVGHEFVKRIPVKTRDVETWVVDEGDMPSGIALDRSAGVHTGEPDVEQKVMHRLSGYDGANNRIAKAEVHFDIREPKGIAVPVRFLAHKGQYSYNVLPSPEGVNVERWDQWNPMPDGMAQRNEALEGYPAEAREYPLLWQGYDYLNRPVAYAYGDFVVTEGPRIDDIVGYSTNPARSQPFRIQAVSHDIIGTAVYRLILVDGVRPDGLEFDAETGVISGVVEDFDWSATFKVKVTDTYDGTSDETEDFVLSTVPASFGMTPPADEIVAYRGENRSITFNVQTTVPGLTWSLAPESAPLPPGMYIEADTQYAVIKGYPREIGLWPGVVLMASAPGFEKKTTAFAIRVRERDMQVRIPRLDVRVGSDVKTAGVTILKGAADPVTFEFSDPSAVPAGMTVNADTGMIELAGGYASVGSYSVDVRIVNGDGQKPVFPQRIQAHPELSFSYDNGTFTRFETSDRLLPVIDRNNIVGTATFTIDPALPQGLMIQPRTGVIQPVWGETVPKSAVGSQQYVVTMTDETGLPIPTAPFTIEVKDRPAMRAQGGTVELERYVGYSQYNPVFPVAVEHAYPAGSARYSYTGTLPEGLSIDERGYFRGNTKAEAGDYPGIRVTVTDGDGPPVTFGPFTVTLKQAKPLQELVGQSKPETWVSGQKFDFQLPGPSNGRKPFKWVLTDAPAGLTVSDDGILSGTIPFEGSYTIRFDVSDDTARDPVEGTLELTVEEPFEFAETVPEWNVYKNLRLEYPEGEIKVERGIKPFTWSVDPSTPLPSGWGLYGGFLTGTASSSTGGFPLTVWMEDRAKVRKSFATFVKFNPPKPLEVSYTEKTLNVGSTSGLPLAPKLNDKTVAIKDWAPVTGLPSGVSFDTLTGEFKAAPYPAESAAGIHVVNVVPRPVDPDVPLKLPSFPVTLKIGYAGEIGFPSVSFRHRVNADISQTLSYSKAVEPVKFTAMSVADGVSFDAATGTFTARFAEPGTYTAGSIKIEENDDPAFDREKTTGFNFEIVSDVVLTVPETMTFGQFDHSSKPITEILNVIGDGDDTTPDVTYALAEGQTMPQGLSVNTLTGAVEGTPDVFGDFGPFNITASDAYGDSSNSNGFTLKIAERKQLEVSYPSGFGHFRRYGVHTSAPQPDNGYGPYTWSIDRDPPSGITFDRATGIFRASSDELVEPQTFTVTVVDSKGGEKGTATADVTVGIAERPQLTVKYENPITFTRHVADMGKDPQKSGTVQRGGALEFTVEPLNGGEALASCIGFDGTTGRFSTDPACTAEVPAGDHRVTVTDATWRNDGNAQGRTTADLRIGVQARPQITLKYEEYDAAKPGFGFQRHNVRTVYPTWNNPLGKDVTWSISPTPPAGITFNEDDGSITVDTADLISDAPYVVTVQDDFDGEQTFPMVLGVGERDRLVFEQDDEQQVPLNQAYELTLSVEHAIGDNVGYEVVSGTLPTGLVFDADGTGDCGVPGTVCGTPDVADHGKSFTWTVKATDDFDGVSDGFPIVFSVVEDATPMTVTYAEPGKARVGYAWSLAAPEVKFAVGNYTFSAPALAQYGLSINAKTGEITGTPNTTFEETFDVTVTDKLGAARAVTVPVKIVSAPTPTITVPNPVSILYNRDIPEDQQLTASGVEDPGVWSVDPAGLPPGLTFDPLTGLFGGQAEDIGVYGPYTLTLDDALPGTFPTVFSFDIAMNDDPIELEELSVLTKVGFPFTTKAPAYDNHYGTVRFLSPELTALGLSVDQTTGVVSGKINEPMDVKPNLVIRDATIRTTSMPVNINVLPRLRLTAPEAIFMTAFETVTPMPSVTPAFQVGAITWEDIDPQFLPVGVTYDTDGTKGCGKAATFCGAPLKEQTLGPFKLAATDTLSNGLTDRAESNEVTIVVRKGVFAMEFLPDGMPGDLPVATKRDAYSHDLVAAGMFEWEGMDLSTINFSLSADATLGEAVPPGLTMKKNGILSGIPADEGTYTFNIVAKYSTKPAVSGKFTLVMELPETELSLADSATLTGDKYEPFSFNFRGLLTHTNIPFDKVTWEPIVALPNDEDPPKTKLPADITMSASGLFSGTPQSSGIYTFSVPVSFKDRTEDLSAAKTYKLVINRKVYTYTKVAAGNSFSCGITPAKNVECWGDNNYGQLGHSHNESPTEKFSLDPRQVVGIEGDVVDIDAAKHMACALFGNGKVMCWGRGYLGDNVFRNFGGSGGGSNPVYFKADNKPITQIDVNGFGACVVTTTKDVYCTDTYAGSSYGGADQYVRKPGVIGGSVERVAKGVGYACAVVTSGDVYCWGDGGEYGSGTNKRPFFGSGTQYQGGTNTPVLAALIPPNPLKLEAGNKATCATYGTGSVSCWGGQSFSARHKDVVDFQFSESGRKCTINSLSQLTCETGGNNYVITSDDVASFGIGSYHVCLIKNDGKSYCGGNGGYGELGNGIRNGTSTPVPVVGK